MRIPVQAFVERHAHGHPEPPDHDSQRFADGVHRLQRVAARARAWTESARVPQRVVVAVRASARVLRSAAAAGADDLSGRGLKHVCPGAFGASLYQPQQLRAWPLRCQNATVVPLVKAGKSGADPKEYTPVSLGSAAAKVAEGVALADMVPETELWDQKAYRRGESAEAETATLVGVIEEAWGLASGCWRSPSTSPGHSKGSSGCFPTVHFRIRKSHPPRGIRVTDSDEKCV